MSFNYAQTRLFAASLVRSRIVPLIIGAPGIGKTAMHALLGKDLDMQTAFFNPSDYEPHEIGGIPCPVDGGLVKLFPTGSPLLRACREPVLLGIDELNAQGASKFPAIARCVNERLVGDLQLHPDTRIVCYTNNQAQSLDGNDLPLPALNRLAPIEMVYEVGDLQKYLATYGEEESPERLVAAELSDMLDRKPDLLEADPSRIGTDAKSFVADIVANNSTWASPRALERLVQFRAQCLRNSTEELGALLVASGEEMVSCIIGPRSARVFGRLLSEGRSLPTAREIADNPLTAKLPTTSVLGLSIAALLPRVAALGGNEAAWLYVNRFNSPTIIGGSDTAASLLKSLLSHCPLNEKTASASVRKIRATMMAQAKVL